MEFSEKRVLNNLAFSSIVHNFDFFFSYLGFCSQASQIQNYGAIFIRTPIILREFYPNAAWSLWLVMKINPVNILLHL